MRAREVGLHDGTDRDDCDRMEMMNTMGLGVKFSDVAVGQSNANANTNDMVHEG